MYRFSAEIKVQKRSDMALEALSSTTTTSCNDLFNFIFYDATPPSAAGGGGNSSLFSENATCPEPQDFPGGGVGGLNSGCSSGMPGWSSNLVGEAEGSQGLQGGGGGGGGGRNKRRRKPKVCKNKEEAETQRMTHIAVERNRRKQMNEHLAVLRSLMPESYVQRVFVCLYFVSFFFFFFFVAISTKFLH